MKLTWKKITGGLKALKVHQIREALSFQMKQKSNLRNETRNENPQEAKEIEKW